MSLQERVAEFDAALSSASSLAERIQLINDWTSLGKATLSSSLSLEDQAVTDAIYQMEGCAVEIFAIDTGRLFEETLYVAQKNFERYGKRLRFISPEKASLEALVEKDGTYGFYDSYDQRRSCCYVRKVEPLNQELSDKSFWLTGLRREQNTTRTELPFVSWDEAHSLVKINPIADWTQEDLDAYIKTNKVPKCALHAKGFPSIGCQPCTRAVKEGDDPRSGRWWWENPDKKECGLHK